MGIQFAIPEYGIAFGILIIFFLYQTVPQHDLLLGGRRDG